MNTRSTVLLKDTTCWPATGIPGLTGEELCIQLTRGYVSLISSEDEALGLSGWRALVQPCKVYAVSRDKTSRNMIYLHREVMVRKASSRAAMVGHEVDHRDQHRLFGYKIVDNRRSNLRNVSRSQNNANQRKRAGCTSRYKGVCWFKRDEKWMAQIRVNLRSIHLGLFVNETEAAEAYNEAHQHHFPGISEGLNRITS